MTRRADVEHLLEAGQLEEAWARMHVVDADAADLRLLRKVAWRMNAPALVWAASVRMAACVDSTPDSMASVISAALRMGDVVAAHQLVAAALSHR